MGEEYITVNEIRDQPAAISALLDELDTKQSRVAEVTSQSEAFCLVGCGTSYFLALSGSAHLNETSISVAVPGSEAFVSPTQITDVNPDIVMPVSRSGESTETVRATEQLRDRYPDATVLGVTCTDGSTLDEQSDVSIVSPNGAEESVVMTKSFSSMLVALEYISRLNAGGRDVAEAYRTLPAQSETVVERAEEIGKDLGARTDLEKFMFLGTGELYGVAAEAMLKLEEMTLSWTKAYHTLEFRHGPRSIADEKTLVTVFLPDRELDLHRDLLADIEATNAEVLVVGPQSSVTEVDATHKLPLPEREVSSLALYAPVFQFLGYYRALAKGLNPDNPQNLTQVVEL